jgi:hypothetical protein
VERELEMRRKVYPSAKGSQATKDYQMQRMQAVLATLQWLKKWEPQIRYMVEGREPGAEEPEDGVEGPTT